MEPSSTAIFGAGQLLSGNDEKAEAAFVVAAKMGWRVPLTQIYWMQRALAVGDDGVAMLRLDALLRQMPEFHMRRDMIDPFETDPGARQQFLASLVTQRPPWMHAYVADIGHLDDGQILQRSVLLDDLAAKGHPLGCDEISGMADRLVRMARYGEAQRFWRLQCHDSSDGIINDGELAHATLDSTSISPFRWSMLSTGDVNLVLTANKGNHIITVSNSSELPMPFVKQLLVMEPGQYRLTWQSKSPGGAGDGVVTPRLECGGDTALSTQVARGDGPNLWFAEFNIAADCPAPWLTFYVKGNTQNADFAKVTMRSL